MVEIALMHRKLVQEQNLEYPLWNFQTIACCVCACDGRFCGSHFGGAFWLVERDVAKKDSSKKILAVESEAVVDAPEGKAA